MPRGVDVQFVFDDYEHVTSVDHESDATTVQSGFGDFTARVKINMWGDDGGGNYHEDFINSITFDHSITGKLSGYLEFFSDISTQHHAGWDGTIDTGFEFPVDENVQLDCGCNFGVTPAADEYNPFAGITVRF